MVECESSNHDGAKVPAVVRIEVSGSILTRCLWCAEGAMSALVRSGVGFTAAPTTPDHMVGSD